MLCFEQEICQNERRMLCSSHDMREQGTSTLVIHALFAQKICRYERCLLVLQALIAYKICGDMGGVLEAESGH